MRPEPTELDLPDALAALASRLRAAGFSPVRSARTESFGDRLVVYAKSLLLVRIVSDRSQWFLELGGRDWDDWFDPDTWKACLDRTELSLEPSTTSEQAEFLGNNLGRIIDAVDRNHGLLECLGEKRALRAKHRLGLVE